MQPADDQPARPDDEVSKLRRLGRQSRRWFFQGTRPYVQRHVEAALMLRAGGHHPGGRYLELGSGRGYGGPIALDVFGADQYVGIDIDAELVERANADYATADGRIVFEHANAVELPYPDEHFDAIVQYAMFHHIRQWRVALGEAVRVLKPGGMFYFEEFLAGLITAPPIRAMFPHPQDSQFTSDDLLEAMSDAGLELLEPPLIVGKLAMGGAARKQVPADWD